MGLVLLGPCKNIGWEEEGNVRKGEEVEVEGEKEQEKVF